MDLIERVQYKAALIVSGCWQGTSREKLYNELGWESLSDRRWSRGLSMYYKIVNVSAHGETHKGIIVIRVHLPCSLVTFINIKKIKVFDNYNVINGRNSALLVHVRPGINCLLNVV